MAAARRLSALAVAAALVVLLDVVVVDAFQQPAGFLPAPMAARRSQQQQQQQRLARAAGGVVASRWGLRRQQGQQQRLGRSWAMSTACPGGPYLGPEFLVGERDACGVGFIADIKGQAGPRAVLDKALVALGCMEHRGACSADSVRCLPLRLCLPQSSYTMSDDRPIDGLATHAPTHPPRTRATARAS